MERKWYGFEMDKKNAAIFREFLIKNAIQFEPSAAYDLVHFECKMNKEEEYLVDEWIKKNLLTW